MRTSRVLNLSASALTELPPLGGMTELHMLDVGHNRLTALPPLPEISGYLYLHDNALPSLPDALCAHTCEMVRFEDFAGARVLIVGGRQSAYEWAALAGEHGAEKSTDPTDTQGPAQSRPTQRRRIEIDVQRIVRLLPA